MSLMISISGIRGTLGSGSNNLNPLNLTEFVIAFASILKEKKKKGRVKVVVGRDGRISGKMFLDLTINILLSQGVDACNLDLASTPTIEMGVIKERADGGIIISASHNPMNWNALKLLNHQGEFIDRGFGKKMIKLLEKKDFALNSFSKLEKLELGILQNNFDYHQKHIADILKLKLVKTDLIKRANFKVVLDGVNSVGAIAISDLLKSLGLKNIIVINSEINGKFSHNPEPIDKNLKQLCLAVKKNKADLGIAVDPDVDRLAIIDENGRPIGEEYTLVAVAEYVLQNFSQFKNKYKKNTVSNLSSSQALKDLTENFSGQYFSAAVGELNVVSQMKKTKAVIGGEGNGGVIFPELHYGRDALVGVALFLSCLAEKKIKVSQWRNQLPNYFMLKERIEIKKEIDFAKIVSDMKECYNNLDVVTIDGIKFIMSKEHCWIHLRKSNTEPIIRLYIEAPNKMLAQKLFQQISSIINNN